MSTLPFQHFDDNRKDYTKLGELFENLISLISSNDFSALLIYIISIIRQTYKCGIKVWLSEPAFGIINVGELNDHDILVMKLSPFKDEAFIDEAIATSKKNASKSENNRNTITIPIQIDNKVDALFIQVEKIEESGFSSRDIKYITVLGNILSIGLRQIQRQIDQGSVQHDVIEIMSIAEISQSILSNLDQVNLLNSTVSLLYQKFGFSSVNILIIKNDKKDKYLWTGISTNGITQETIVIRGQDLSPIAQCISKKELFVINDTANDERFSQAQFEINIKAELVYPILQGEQLLGVLDLCSDRANSFPGRTVDHFKLIADTLALAIRNANLLRVEHLGTQIPESLQAAAGTLSVDISIETVLENILNEISKYIPYDVGAFWLVDNSASSNIVDQYTDTFHLAALKQHRKFVEEPDLSHVDDQDDGHDITNLSWDKVNDLFVLHNWVGEVINNKTTRLRETTDPYEPIGAMLDFGSDYSAIGSPLKVKNKIFGVLVLVHHLPEQFDRETKEILSIICNYVSPIIENVRLYSIAHDQAWISTVLLQIAEATQSVTNIDELLETAVDILPGLIGVSACAIYIWDPSNEAFTKNRFTGFDELQSNRLNEWNISATNFNAFEEWKNFAIPIVLNSETLSNEIIEKTFEYYDLEKDLLIFFPLTTQNGLCGALLVDFTNSDLGINSSQSVWDEKYTLIQGAANQIAIGIENLQLIKSQEEETYISVALLQVAQAIVSMNQLDEILETIVRITPILVGVKRCIIYVWDSKEREFYQSRNFGFTQSDLDLLGRSLKGIEFPIIDAIHQSDQILYHPLGSTDVPQSWRGFSITGCFTLEETEVNGKSDQSYIFTEKPLGVRERLLIGFPISIKGENLGVMLIEEEDQLKRLPSQHIREKRIEIIRGITQQAAIAMKNELLQKEALRSEVMERELQLAREIQKAFLPEEIPQIPGWDIDVRWQPARQVGGDFYDVIYLNPDRIGFVIADVADKGMPAALFMTLIRTLIRAASRDKESPSSVLKEVNELLIPDTKNGMFVTVFYGILSKSSGKFVYANCGHNPPICKQFEANKYIQLTRTGMALGIFSDIDIDENEIVICPGDWLLMYTDGVTEAFSPDEEMYGTGRLVNVLTGLDFTCAKSLLDIVENSVNEFINGIDLSDDMTLTAIYRIKEY